MITIEAASMQMKLATLQGGLYGVYVLVDKSCVERWGSVLRGAQRATWAFWSLFRGSSPTAREPRRESAGVNQ